MGPETGCNITIYLSFTQLFLSFKFKDIYFTKNKIYTLAKYPLIMLKKIFLSSLLFVCISTTLFSQRNNDTFGDHLRYGGSFNAGFSNSYTTIGIAPSVIYDFYNGFNAGVSLSYFHTNDKEFDISSNVYGGSIITLYNAFNTIQLSAELEESNVNYSGRFVSEEFDSFWVTGLYLGVAYATRNFHLDLGMTFFMMTEKVYTDRRFLLLLEFTFKQYLLTLPF